MTEWRDQRLRELDRLIREAGPGMPPKGRVPGTKDAHPRPPYQRRKQSRLDELAERMREESRRQKRAIAEVPKLRAELEAIKTEVRKLLAQLGAKDRNGKR